MSTPAVLEKELFDELAAHLAAALETMAGERPPYSWDPLPSPPAAHLRWRQSFASLQGAIWLLATEDDMAQAAQLVLKATGITDADAAELRSTYLELSNQAFSALTQSLASRLHREITPADGAEATIDPPPARWAEIHIKLGDASFALAAGLEDAFLSALAQPPPSTPSISAPAAVPVPPAPDAEIPGPPKSRTFDLLLDVELPVSVSFGRAQIPLKDVLKLTTGSIVELNRSIVEPVEIIVNNCVIARGEVVVVEGNFGVRIQEVISRQERLRTLQ